MTRAIKILAVAALSLLAMSCSKKISNKMVEMAGSVKVQCTPAVLEVIGDEVPVSITVNYPKEYFHPDAMMVVTPVLIYEGGQLTGKSYIYQGEKIKDNNKVVKYSGGSVSEKMSFEFFPGMEKSYLELRSVAIYGDQKVNLPAVKVADGCNVTCRLADASGAFDYKPDGYQLVVPQTTEGQIMYDVNSDVVKNNQLNSSSIRNFKAALKEMQENDRVKVKGTQIISYASPEGGEKLNTKLSDKRASSAEKAWDKIAGKADGGQVETRSMGQDWEGFQEAVSKSNIQDKDLILRVLSMYSDPAVRESEIKNMSQIYTDIKKDVFPELRRARFITNVEYQNYTEEELVKIAAKRINILGEDALLRLGTISEDLDHKALYYRMAAERYNSARGFYNLGIVSLDDGRPAVTEVYLDRLGEDSDPDVLNARGVIALRAEEIDKAEKFFTKSGNATAKANLGTIKIMKGDYKGALDCLAGSGNPNEALAYLLNGQLDKADKAVKGDNAESWYLRAVIAARRGNASAVKGNLAKAYVKDPALKDRAAKDIEFAKYR